jgi:hypothetical protein
MAGWVLPHGSFMNKNPGLTVFRESLSSGGKQEIGKGKVSGVEIGWNFGDLRLYNRVEVHSSESGYPQ